MIASNSLENTNVAFENYEILGNPDMFPMEIDLNSDGTSMFVQNYILQSSEDGNYQLVLCESQSTQQAAKNGEEDREIIDSDRSRPIQIDKAPDHTAYSCIKCKEQFNEISLFRKHLKWHKSDKKFKCIKCSVGFNSENNLKVHTVIHHPGHTNICPICNIKFQRKASLKSHMIVHQSEEVFDCDECQAEFHCEDELWKHMEMHAVKKVSKTTSDSLVCPYCKLDFSTAEEHKQHVARHVEVKRNVLRGKKSRKRRGNQRVTNHKCKYCGKMFPKGCLLVRHERIHTGVKPYVCKVCHKSFAQTGTLHIHLGSHTGLKPYSCTLCPAKFTQKGNLRAHIDKTHTAPKGNQRMYKCTQCACIFKKIATLNGHITKVHLTKEQENEPGTEAVIDRVMDDLRMFNDALSRPKKKLPLGPVQDQPGTSWVRLAENETNGTVRRYLVRQKKVGDVRWYFCDSCPSKFKKPSDLIRHNRTHTLEKPFKCSKCHQAFSLKSTLMNHVKTHGNQDQQDEDPRNVNENRQPEEKDVYFACESCASLFTSMEEYERHKITQHDQEAEVIVERTQPVSSVTEYPHHCTICNARFSRFINLKKHALHHTDEKKHRCPLCAKTFITKYRLTEHVNYHKNIRNYACQVCGKNFVTSSILKRHMTVHDTFKNTTSCHAPELHVIINAAEDTAEPPKELCQDNTPLSQDVVDSSNITGASLATGDSVVLTVGNPRQQGPLDLSQMVYLDINDVRLVNEATGVDNDAQLATLSDHSLFFNPESQEGSILFNVEAAKAPAMVDPNVVIKTTAYGATERDKEVPELSAYCDVGMLMENVDVPVNITAGSEGDKSGVNLLDAHYYCVSCHLIFTDAKLFQEHACPAAPLVTEPHQTATSCKQFLCECCSQPFTDGEALIQHMSDDHGVSGPTDRVCRFCVKEFKKPSDLTRHLRTHTGEKPFECLQCKKKFSLKSTLESHKRTHEGSQKNVSCDVCNGIFTTKSSLKVHMLLHTGARPHACSYCEQTFRTLAIRKAHEKNIHLNQTRRPSSPKGVKLLKNVADLVTNILRQQDMEPACSDIAQADFLQQIPTISLQDYAPSDIGALDASSEVAGPAEACRPPKVECDVCHKLYASKDVLRKHRKKVHGQNKRFPCIKCDKGYDDMEELNRHLVKNHSGHRPYSCQYCSNSFGEENSLKTHIKRIHPSKFTAASETIDALLSLQFDLPLI